MSRPVERPRWPVWSSGLLLAILCAMVLWGRVYLDFDGVRLKVLQTERPATQGVINVTLPESPRYERLAPPAVFIARLRNASPRAETIAVSLGSTPLTTVTLAPGANRRIDIVAPDDRRIGAGDTLNLTSDAGDAACSLEYLEVANHHGSSKVILTFFIVPRSTRTYGSPSLPIILIVTILVALLVPYGDAWLRSRRARIAQRVLTSAVAMLFVVFLAASLLTPYKLLLAPASFAICALALTWPGLTRGFVEARDTLDRRWPALRPILVSAVVALLVALFYILIARTLLANYGRNYSGFLQIGSAFADRVPFLTDRPDLKRQLLINKGGGYDGQFFYMMTFDPFLLAFKDDPIRYRDVVDAPPYRYGRIGFTLLTRVFSGDQPEWYPQTMVWLIIGASFVGAMILSTLAQQHGYSAAWGLLYVLVPGFVQSLHVALPETIAAAGLVAGFWLVSRGQPAWATIPLAASLLLRETGIIFIIALVIWQALRARNVRTAATLAASVLPFIVWRAYVGWRLFPDFRWEAFFFNPNNTGVPYQGILEMWRLVRSGQYLGGAADIATSATFYPLLLTAGLVLGAWLFWKRRDGLSGAIFVYALLAVSLNYVAIWVHVGNAERGTYELFLLSIVAFITIDRRERLTRRLLGAFFVCAALYLWFASVDAALVRYSLFM